MVETVASEARPLKRPKTSTLEKFSANCLIKVDINGPNFPNLPCSGLYFLTRDTNAGVVDAVASEARPLKRLKTSTYEKSSANGFLQVEIKGPNFPTCRVLVSNFAAQRADRR